MKASHKTHWMPTKTGKGHTQIKLDPGQFIFGRFESAKELGMKPSSVRNRMKKLKSMQNLDIKPDTHFSIITIMNWGIYQVINNVLGQPTGHPVDTQRTPKGHIQECKEGNNVKNNIYKEMAVEVINYLNEKTGKKYKDDKNIMARIKEGKTVAECKQIIDIKMFDPWFQEKPHLYNPNTLFRQIHWDTYINQTEKDFAPFKGDSRTELEKALDNSL